MTGKRLAFLTTFADGITVLNIFTLEIDGQPILVFDAASREEAEGICALDEFRADLCHLTANNLPICYEHSALAAREATPAEMAVFNAAIVEAVPSEGPTMTFLVPVDGVIISVVEAD